MNVFLVHHADAVSPAIDPQRPLSPLGLAQADWLAGEARRLGVMPAVIWHSGKLRARQTAEAFLVACNPSASFATVRGLRPEDPAVWMRDLLLAEERDVLLAGHMPHLPDLLQLLSGGEAFPLHGLVWLARRADGTFEEKRRVLCSPDLTPR